MNKKWIRWSATAFLVVPTMIAFQNCAPGTAPSASPTSQGRQAISSPLTLYVSTLGNDTNNSCLASTSPCGTITYAAGLISDTMILGNVPVTIQLADGTYNEDVVLRDYLGSGLAGLGNAVIAGNSSSNLNVVVNANPSAPAFTAVAVKSPWILQNLTVSGNSCIEADWGSFLYIKNVNFGVCGVGISTIYGSHVEALAGGYTISGNSTAHINAAVGGFFTIQTGTITLLNNPQFGIFASAQNLASVDFTQASFSGSYTVTSPSAADAKSVLIKNSLSQPQ